MKKLFTVLNCVIISVAFITGFLISRYEDRFGVLTVTQPKISEEKRLEPILSNDTSGKIDINTASVDEFEKINGIGEKLAERIINYRDTNGKFNQTEDIMKVNGIGKSIFNKIKDEICVR